MRVPRKTLDDAFADVVPLSRHRISEDIHHVPTQTLLVLAKMHGHLSTHFCPSEAKRLTFCSTQVRAFSITAPDSCVVEIQSSARGRETPSPPPFSAGICWMRSRCRLDREDV